MFTAQSSATKSSTIQRTYIDTGQWLRFITRIYFSDPDLDSVEGKVTERELHAKQEMLLEMALVLVWWLFVVGVTLDHDEDDVDDDGDGKGMVGNDRVGCLWTHTSPASRALSRPRICIYSTPISWNAQKFDAASFSTKLGQSGMADQFAISTSDYVDSSCTESLVMVMAPKI